MSRHRPKKNFWVKFWVMFFEMHSVLCHFFFNLKNDTKKIKTECIQCFCVIWRDLWLVAVVSFFLIFFYFFNFLRSLERLVACGCFAWKVNAGLGFRVYGLGAVERLTR